VENAKAVRRVTLIQTQAEAAGAQEISRLLAENLAGAGYAVDQVFLYRRTDAFDGRDDTYFCACERPSTPFGFLGIALSLFRRLRAFRPDVAICFQHYGNLAGAAAARAAGVPLIIANRNTSKDNVPSWAMRLERLFGVCGIFDRLVVNCGEVEQEYHAHPARFQRRIRRVDHGFMPKISELDRRAARASLGLPEQAVLLGVTARLHPGKDLGAAIRLLALRPHWRLAIAGQGPQREELIALATSLGVDSRLHLVGELSPEGVGRFLRALDAFVFPSRSETFGLAAVEAAQAGLPVICNDLPVMREVLSVGGEPCAIFVDTSDTAAFAEKVDAALADAAVRTRLIEQARALSEKYSLQRMSDGYRALLVPSGA
jgi:glycosyltransferase involved in cell wall biosynthesis